jgi:hypothetical protein
VRFTPQHEEFRADVREWLLGELAMDIPGAASLVASASPGGRPPQTPRAGDEPR